MTFRLWGTFRTRVSRSHLLQQWHVDPITTCKWPPTERAGSVIFYNFCLHTSEGVHIRHEAVHVMPLNLTHLLTKGCACLNMYTLWSYILSLRAVTVGPMLFSLGDKSHHKQIKVCILYNLKYARNSTVWIRLMFTYQIFKLEMNSCFINQQ